MGLESFESDILAIILKDKEKFIKYSRKLTKNHFRNNILRFIYEISLSYFNKFKNLPTRKVIKNEIISSLSLPSEEKKQYLIVLRKIFERIPKEKEYTEDKVSENLLRENTIIAISKSLKELEEGNVDFARKNLLKELLLGKEIEGEKLIKILGDWKTRQLFREKMSKLPLSERFVPTPYSYINTFTSGIQKTETATIAGMTNSGKSIIAHEFGINAMLESVNVLHFTFENTGEQTAQRYDSRLTEISYDTIKFYKFSETEIQHFNKVFSVLSSAILSDVVVVETIRNETDIFYVDKIVEELKMGGFEVGFLIIDSCDIMKSSQKYSEYRLDRASVYWDFKDYCKLKKLPGLTTTQLKSTSKWKISTVEDLAEAYDKARILDIVYIMSQTEEDQKNNIMRFSVDKSRDSKAGFSIKLFKDSERMRFLEVV